MRWLGLIFGTLAGFLFCKAGTITHREAYLLSSYVTSSQKTHLIDSYIYYGIGAAIFALSYFAMALTKEKA